MKTKATLWEWRKEMKVILFKQTLDDRGTLFAQHVAAQTTRDQLLVCGSIAQLVETLRRHITQEVLLVLLAETQQCLLALHSQRELLRHYRLILVLPDGDEATFSMGHKFHPRFLTTLDEAPEHLGAVLARMLKNGAATDSPSYKLSFEQPIEYGKNVDFSFESEYCFTESKKQFSASEKGGT